MNSIYISIAFLMLFLMVFSDFLCDVFLLSYAATKNRTREKNRMPFFVFLRDHCVLVMLFHFMYLMFLDWPFQALSIAYFSSALRCSCNKLHCFNSDLLGNHSFWRRRFFHRLCVCRVFAFVLRILCAIAFSNAQTMLFLTVFSEILCDIF